MTTDVDRPDELETELTALFSQVRAEPPATNVDVATLTWRAAGLRRRRRAATVATAVAATAAVIAGGVAGIGALRQDARTPSPVVPAGGGTSSASVIAPSGYRFDGGPLVAGLAPGDRELPSGGRRDPIVIASGMGTATRCTLGDPAPAASERPIETLSNTWRGATGDDLIEFHIYRFAESDTANRFQSTCPELDGVAPVVGQRGVVAVSRSGDPGAGIPREVFAAGTRGGYLVVAHDVASGDAVALVGAALERLDGLRALTPPGDLAMHPGPGQSTPSGIPYAVVQTDLTDEPIGVVTDPTLPPATELRHDADGRQGGRA